MSEGVTERVTETYLANHRGSPVEVVRDVVSVQILFVRLAGEDLRKKKGGKFK